MTPLHIASLHDYIELAKVLLEAGAKLDAKDSNGKVKLALDSEFSEVGIGSAHAQLSILLKVGRCAA